MPTTASSPFKQSYPTFASPSLNASSRGAFTIKVLDTSSELIQSYRLRHEVFQSLGYLQRASKASLEIDEYDAYSIPFGAISLETRELVGTLRLITHRVQPFYALRIQRILELCNDPELSTQVLRRRSRVLPSITSSRINDCLACWNDGRQTEEFSRMITHPSFRGHGLSRRLIEFGLACSMITEAPMLIAACVPEHVSMYARYGYGRLPGTEISRNDTVDQLASTVVCDSKRLPEPARSRVRAILTAMRSGEPECPFESDAGNQGGRSRGTYHFGQHVVNLVSLAQRQPEGARQAVR